MTEQPMICTMEVADWMNASIEAQLADEYGAFHAFRELLEALGLSFDQLSTFDTVVLSLANKTARAAFALGVQVGAGAWRSLILEPDAKPDNPATLEMDIRRMIEALGTAQTAGASA
mgnify:CR=1 FL=1